MNEVQLKKLEKFKNSFSREDQILIYGYLRLKKLRKNPWLYCEELLKKMLIYMKDNDFRYCEADSKVEIIVFNKLHSNYCHNKKPTPYKTFDVVFKHPQIERIQRLFFYEGKILGATK